MTDTTEQIMRGSIVRYAGAVWTVTAVVRLARLDTMLALERPRGPVAVWTAAASARDVELLGEQSPLFGEDA